MTGIDSIMSDVMLNVLVMLNIVKHLSDPSPDLRYGIRMTIALNPSEISCCMSDFQITLCSSM